MRAIVRLQHPRAQVDVCGVMSEPMPLRSWRCSTLFHQRSTWFWTIAGSSTKICGCGRGRRVCRVGAGDGGEELPSGKDGDAAGGDGARHQVVAVVVAGGFDARAAEARVHGREQPLGDRVSVSGSSSASSSGVEERCDSGSNLRIDSISSPKKFDAHGAVRLGRVDVEDAAAAGELAGHLDDVHRGVADAGEVVEEHLDVHLFAAAQPARRST